MLGYIGSVLYRCLPSHVKNGVVILLCIFESIIKTKKNGISVKGIDTSGYIVV